MTKKWKIYVGVCLGAFLCLVGGVFVRESIFGVKTESNKVIEDSDYEYQKNADIIIETEFTGSTYISGDESNKANVNEIKADDKVYQNNTDIIVDDNAGHTFSSGV